MSAAADTPLLAIRGLRAAYGKIEALKGVDLDVKPGEIVALIGANGAGKSTLMMTIFGRPRASAGQIEFDGRDITAHADARDRAAAHRAIAGGPAHFPAHERRGKSADGRGRRRVAATGDRAASLERVLALFPRLKERLTQRGGTLSGGEQQMLAIGRALMSRPRLLMLDEPSLGLAPLIARQIFDAIRTLNQRGRSHRADRRAERQPRAEARASRLCHGQRPDHAERHRRGIAAAAGNPRGLSRRRPART